MTCLPIFMLCSRSSPNVTRKESLTTLSFLLRLSLQRKLNRGYFFYKLTSPEKWLLSRESRFPPRTWVFKGSFCHCISFFFLLLVHAENEARRWFEKASFDLSTPGRVCILAYSVVVSFCRFSAENRRALPINPCSAIRGI